MSAFDFESGWMLSEYTRDTIPASLIKVHEIFVDLCRRMVPPDLAVADLRRALCADRLAPTFALRNVGDLAAPIWQWRELNAEFWYRLHLQASVDEAGRNRLGFDSTVFNQHEIDSLGRGGGWIWYATRARAEAEFRQHPSERDAARAKEITKLLGLAGELSERIAKIEEGRNLASAEADASTITLREDLGALKERVHAYGLSEQEIAALRARTDELAEQVNGIEKRNLASVEADAAIAALREELSALKAQAEHGRGLSGQEEIATLHEKMDKLVKRVTEIDGRNLTSGGRKRRRGGRLNSITRSSGPSFTCFSTTMTSRQTQSSMSRITQTN